MSDIVLKYPYVLIDSVEYSSVTQEVSIDYGAELQDNTAGQVTATATRINIGGLKTWSMEFKFKQSFTDAEVPEVDELLFVLVGSSAAIVVRADKGNVVSASNPEYQGTGILASYPPLGQAIGEHITTTVRFEAAGALTRAVA